MKLLYKILCFFGCRKWEDWVAANSDYGDNNTTMRVVVCPRCGKVQAYLVRDEGLKTEDYGGVDQQASESLTRLIYESLYSSPFPLTVRQAMAKGRFIATIIVSDALNEHLGVK